MIYINRIKNTKPFPEREGYPYSIPSMIHLEELRFRKSVTFITGENGSGKSTLIEAIAINAGFNAEGGSRNFNFHTQESHSDLYENLKLIWTVRNRDGFFLRAESFYNFSSNMDTLDKEPGGARINESYGGKSLHERSHGEGFLSLVYYRLRGNGLYIFDEPESALSFTGQLKLMVMMKELVGKNSQFIIATHSPVLMSYPGADIYVVSEEGINLTDYEDTDPYKLTKYFMNNYPKVISDLGLSEEN